MTKEEYQSRTNIASVDEAKSRLLQLRILFVAVFFLPIFRDVLPLPAVAILGITLLYIALWIYFIVYCVIVIRLTREVTKADAFWSIILAPISWIWFYPAITDPLKIIIGAKAPPETIPTAADRAHVQKNATNRFWRTLLYVFVALAAFLTISYFLSKQ